MKELCATLASICAFAVSGILIVGVINFLFNFGTWDFLDLNHYLWFGIFAVAGVVCSNVAQDSK